MRINSRREDCMSSIFILVISFTLKPATRILSEKIFANFIIDKDKDREGNSRDPPIDFQRIHSQSFIHARSVTQKGSKKSFKDQSKVEHVVSQAL